MSIENVKEYFDLLENDKEFAEAVFATGEDKSAKMALVREKGFDFTAEEYDLAVSECVEKVENAFENSSAVKTKISDKVLDEVNAAGLIGLIGLIPGAYVGLYYGAAKGVISGGVEGIKHVVNGGNVFDGAQKYIDSTYKCAEESARDGAAIGYKMEDVINKLINPTK